MSQRPVYAPLALLCVPLALAGCSMEEIKRFGFENGQQYACKQAAAGKPNESMEEFKCMTPVPPAKYEDYQKARAELLEGD